MFDISNDGMVHTSPLPKQFSSDLLVLEKGEGVHLRDAKGNEYLDFGAGIAVNALGYGREDLAEIAAAQMKKIIHTSNLYTTKPTLELGAKLTASGPFAAVHFGNSGAEANEAAIKYARAYSMRKKGPGHHKLLCFDHAFHGRTMGALSVTPTAAYRDPFEPLVPGVEVCTYGDETELERKLDPSFAGVIVEVVQGEGGLRVMKESFAKALNNLCRKNDVILIADEVQTGLGRTGHVYASRAVGLEADIITLAKPLAGGLPLSATLIPEKINSLLKLGDHGTTFGGGPVTTAVASKVWDMVTDAGFLAAVKEKGERLGVLLSETAKEFSLGTVRIGEVRGMGMLRGLEVLASEEKTADVMKAILAKAQEAGLLVLRSGKNIIRIAPPLVISKDELAEGVALLKKALAEVRKTF